MKRLILVLFVLTITLPSTTVMAKNFKHAGDIYVRESHARESYDDSYATIKLGGFMPNENTDFLDNGLVIGGAIGHKLNRNFALEIGLDNIFTDFDDDYVYEDVDVTTLGIPVTAKIVVPLSNQVELYVGGGLGLYFTSIQYDHEYYDEYYHDDGVDDTSFGYHSLVGADIKMNQNMAFTMELKYVQIEQDFDDYYYDDLGVGGTTATFGVKFLF